MAGGGVKVLAVTGGVPRYLEEINPKLTAEENIYRLCYREGNYSVKHHEAWWTFRFSLDSHKNELSKRSVLKVREHC